MAKNMRFKDFFCHRITFRLSDKQFDFLVSKSAQTGFSPSDLLRKYLDYFIHSEGK